MKNLFKALAEFQQEVPVIHKGTKGYGYSYSDLPTIFPIINPLLKKHKLGFTQLIDGKSIKTIIFHTESGETLESSTDIPEGVTLKGMNNFQVLGSAVTYIRRYALSSALGLVTDKDTDAGGQQTSKPTPPPVKAEKKSDVKPQPETNTKSKEDVFVGIATKEKGMSPKLAKVVQKAINEYKWSNEKVLKLLAKANHTDVTEEEIKAL